MNERQAHADLTDRRTYSPRIHFDYKACGCSLGLTQCNCCGVTTEESAKIASDFMTLHEPQSRRISRLVNWLAVALVLVIAAWVVFG